MAEGWISTSMPYVVPGERGRPDAWTAQGTEAARTTQRVLHAGRVPMPEDVGRLLDLPDAEVIVRRRAMYVNDRPVELTDSYFPLSIAAGTRLAEPRKIPGGAVRLLADLGHVAHRVHEDVTVRPPDDDERALLDLPANEPLLILTRLTLDTDDRPFQADVMAMPNGHLRYELTIG
ncbi:GntR family transcriptional regulator [Actinomadura atramentaria]|uniref:GntR family transcriptional regulator n=1 Tax=Actinomadura atramentaria TaxID=1990 RepID=UPI0003809393|nr:UTRA domain-containing protein [Actinomadura atramentaria]